ncbi:MAG: Methyl-accepting chemotaxis protein I (serine chemoreceptor protein) [uncultured Paraburkholderia sp.]|nr:MAG: Methyl-accepting chemotaxis protein I (serine chemoreceptor protein) [uncultured Paraburkholderia sp.]
MVAHPMSPQLNGKDMSGFRDAKGRCTTTSPRQAAPPKAPATCATGGRNPARRSRAKKSAM